MTRPPHLLVFEPNVGGHHGMYLRHLVARWRELSPPGRLSLVVAPMFAVRHADVAALAEGAVDLHPLSAAEHAAWRAHLEGRGRLDQTRGALAEWGLLTRWAARLHATRALVPYLDRLLMAPLALGLRAPCPVAGVYFRPSFHYDALLGTRPTGRERLRALRQRVTLWRALRNPALETIYSLDPFVVPLVARWPGRRAAFVALPDPVEVPDASPVTPAALRARLAVPPDRRLALLFGVLTARKGLHPLLEALPLLPPEVADRLALALVGPVAERERPTIETSLARARQSARVPIALVDAFAPEAEVQAWFEAADIVLAPYQRHVGSSGIVIRAAAAQRPLLASDYGLMGEQTRRRRLGLTVDAADPRALADALARLVRDPASACDPASMRAFAAENSPRAFADLLLTPPPG